MIDKFRAKFVEESKDNIRDLEEALFMLENDMENKELIERIFRAMHSLKGGGAMFGFEDLSEFTHHLETIFDWVRNNKLKVTTDLITLTFSAIDQITYLLNQGNLTDEADIADLKNFITRLQNFLTGSESSEELNVAAYSASPEEVSTESAQTAQTTYLITFIPELDLLQNGTNPLFLIDDLHSLGEAIPIAYTHKIPSVELFGPTSNYCVWQIILSTDEPLNEIKDVFIFVEDECDLTIDKLADRSIVKEKALLKKTEKAAKNNILLKKDDFADEQWEVDEVVEQVEAPTRKRVAQVEHKISSIRVSSDKIDELVTLVSELVTIQAQLSLYSENSEDATILALSENIEKLSRQLRENAFDISLIPLQSELMRFQRLIRDLSKEQEKEIEFIIEGGDIELDKNIIENLTDPLLHILRNSIDHGIEMPEDRLKAGKSPKGTIVFKAYYSGANVIIEISDDGKGLDPDMILKKAIDRELVEEGKQLSHKEILNLLFLSGFTTRDKVTDVSGRGVGMDVVRRKIAEIRGEVSIESEKGKGTILTIKLPLTLSIIDGLLVKVADNQYVIPLSAIEKIHAIEPSRFKNTFNQAIEIEGEQIPYVSLRQCFNIEEKEDEDIVQMVVLEYDNRITGLIVDSVIGEYQTVVKPLGRYLKIQDLLSGASIMGDGSISLVIDTSRLFQLSKTKSKTA